MMDRFQRNLWTAAGECLDKNEQLVNQPATFPDCSQAAIETFFQESLSTDTEDHSLPPTNLLGLDLENAMEWEAIDVPTIAVAISSKRPSAAPGSDTVGNAFLRRCEELYPFIAQVFNDVLKHSVSPPYWKQAVTRLIHKGGAPNQLSNWRPISLTSCLGKLLHSIIGHRILSHAVTTGIIDTTIQKGFLPNVNGTIEHTQSLCELLDFQRQHKRQYCLGQFDLKNAFGSLPHSILFQVLTWANVSPQIIAYIRSLYHDATIRIKCSEGLTQHIPVKRGVLQGDTLSPVLFNLAMEVVLRYLRSSFPSYGIKWGNQESFLKAFADDLAIITNSAEKMQHVTNALMNMLSRLGMRLNVPKCRLQHMSVAEGGYKTHRPRILAYGESIPNVCDKGSQFLGMTLAPGTQQGKALFKSLLKQLRFWLNNVSNSALDTPARLWAYNNVIISRLRYVLTVNPGITLNFILRLQKYATRHIRKWINMAKTATSEVLYSERGWALTSLSKLWLLCTGTAVEQMRKSRDPAVQQALRYRIRREHDKRSSGQVRPVVELYDRSGNHASTRQYIEHEYERHLSEAVQRRAPIAGQWFRMATEDDLAKDFAAALCNIKSTSLSRFASSVLTQTPLPTRSALHRWGLSSHTNRKCPICTEDVQTVRHVLTGCKAALQQGRYTFRHNLILHALADAIRQSPETAQYHFDLAHHQNPPTWMSGQETSLRPDGWVQLKNGSEFILELTSPWEENFISSHERKMQKYGHTVCIYNGKCRTQPLFSWPLK